MPKQPDIDVSPFTILIDQREQIPYSFRSISSSFSRHIPMLVRSQFCLLMTGDYTISGLESEVAVERKSLQDLYSTIGQGRERFERELQRLSQFNCARVVIESSWDEIIHHPPKWSQLSPKAVYRSIIAWANRYPSVHWMPMENREFAEITTFRVLERYYLDKMNGVMTPCQTTTTNQSKD